MPGAELGTGYTTDMLKLGAWTLQEAEERMSDKLVWKDTLTFDRERVRLKPGTVMEPDRLESLARLYDCSVVMQVSKLHSRFF